MRRIAISMGLVLGLVVGSASCSCPNGGKGDGNGNGSKADGGTVTNPTAADLRWDLDTARTLTYVVKVPRSYLAPSVALPLTETFALTVDNGGEVALRKDGGAFGNYTMEPSGRLVAKAGSQLPPPELTGFFVISNEAMGTEALKVGDTFERLDPTAAQVAASTEDVVLQSRRVYTVRAVTPGGEVILDFLGYTRFVDTPKARALLLKLFPGIDQPGTAADGAGAQIDDWKVLTQDRLYLSGSVHFDLAKRQVTKGNAVLIIAREEGLSPADLATRDDRMEMTIALQ